MKNPVNDTETFLVKMKIVANVVVVFWGPTIVTRYVMPRSGTMMMNAFRARKLMFWVGVGR